MGLFFPLTNLKSVTLLLAIMKLWTHKMAGKLVTEARQIAGR